MEFTMETTIKWYDATKVHPAKNCMVLLAIKSDAGKEINTIMDVTYHDGHFNGKEHSMNRNAAWWAYFDDVTGQMLAKEEDDF